jgi:hypothetical protein
MPDALELPEIRSKALLPSSRQSADQELKDLENDL